MNTKDVEIKVSYDALSWGAEKRVIPSFYQAGDYAVTKNVCGGWRGSLRFNHHYVVSHLPSGHHTGYLFHNIISAARFAKWMRDNMLVMGENPAMLPKGVIRNAVKRMDLAARSFGGWREEDAH